MLARVFRSWGWLELREEAARLPLANGLRRAVPFRFHSGRGEHGFDLFWMYPSNVGEQLPLLLVREGIEGVVEED